MKSLPAPTKVRTCPVACFVECYLTSRHYIACQTDTLRLFSDSPTWDMLWKLLINYFRHSIPGEDQKQFSRTSAFRVRDRLSWILPKSLGKLHQRSELFYLKIHTTMNFVFLDFLRNGIAVLDRNLNVYACGMLRYYIGHCSTSGGLWNIASQKVDLFLYSHCYPVASIRDNKEVPASVHINIFFKSNRKITNENYTEIWRRQTSCP